MLLLITKCDIFIHNSPFKVFSSPIIIHEFVKSVIPKLEINTVPRSKQSSPKIVPCSAALRAAGAPQAFSLAFCTPPPAVALHLALRSSSNQLEHHGGAGAFGRPPVSRSLESVTMSFAELRFLSEEVSVHFGVLC